MLERLLCIDTGVEGPKDEVIEIAEEPESTCEDDSSDEEQDGTSMESIHI